MKPLTLHPHEIRRLIDTGTVTVWRPIPQLKLNKAKRHFILHNGVVWASVFREELPPADLHRTVYGGAVIYVSGVPFTEIRVGKGPKGEGNPLKPPHPPGSERWVKERFGWAVTPKGKSVIVYQADNQARPVLCDNEGEGDCVVIGKKPVEYVAVDGVLWKAAQRMPRWASRLSVVSTAVQARQVQTVTEKEAEQTGVHPGGFAARRAVPFFKEWWQSRYGRWHPDEWAWATTLERKEG